MVLIYVHNSTLSSFLNFGFGELKNAFFFLPNFREKAEEIARIRSELKDKGLLTLRRFAPKIFLQTDKAQCRTCAFRGFCYFKTMLACIYM